MVMDESKSPVSNNKVGKTSQALSPVKLHKVKGSYGQVESGGEGEGEVPSGGEGVWSISRQEESPSNAAAVVASPSYKELRMSQSHSKKVIKHALRQQAKRRRKNTTIAAGNSAPLPRILMPPQCELEEASNRTSYRPPTMLEVLSSIPGFSIKQRKRSNKKLSAAAQLEQTKEGCIDLETPDSILVNTNLRSLLNKHTFNTLPALYQYKLVQLLPHVDRTTPAGDSFRLSASGLNNEFFARACLEWKERLAEGEFTPENQQKLKAEAEREKSKLDPWKLKHFEPIWGESASGVGSVRVEWTPPPAAVPPKPAKPPVKVKTPPTPPPPRLRTVGAITRAVASYREKREAEENNLTEPNKRVKSSNKSESPKTETISSAESTSILQPEAESRANKAELRLAEEEMSKANKAEFRPADEEMSRANKAEFRPADEEMSRANKAELRLAEEEMSRANKAEFRPADEEMSRANKAEFRPADEEMSRANKAELRPAEEEMRRANKAELKPAEEEMKEDEIKVKDDWGGELVNEVSVESKSDSVDEMGGKCTELSVGEWGSVEVVSVDPAQDVENTDTEKHMEDELSYCSKNRLVCDISASDNTVAKEETVLREEVKEEAMEEGVSEKEEDLKEEDTQDGNDSQEESHSACTFSKQTIANEEVTESETLTNNETGALEVNDAHNENVCDIIEPLENDMKLSESLHNDLCEVIDCNQDKVNQDKVPSDSCDKSVGDITEDNDGQEGSECMTDLDSLSHQEQGSLHQDETEMPASQESTSTYDCNSAVTEEEKFNIHITEGQSTEETSEEKFVEELPENLNEERYDVDMANINDSLELVNEETSLQPSIETHTKEELSNHQEFVDSQSDLKDDGGGYSVKMEEELDLQDTTSNIQSQDSQDTRPDEELSCPQDNSPEFIIPDSEIVVSGVDEADCGDSARGDGNYNMYSSELYQEALKEEVEAAAIFAAAWGAVDSSTEKLLAQVALQEEGEVNVIPMQEELEVRLEEIKSGSEWPNYEKLSAPSAPLGQQDKPHSPPQYPGHVKLELEVTLTPEVDSQVSSTMEGSSTAGGSGLCSSGSTMCDDTSVNVSTALTVIPPTTIVCLPSATPQLPPHTTAAPGVVSSSAVPYLALSTSTPVRALPTKPKPSVGVQSGGRTSRNVSSKPPPGAVNLERSYQICQAVIQNSPNRDQLRCQLKPPPSLLIGKSDKTQYSVVTSSRASKVVGPSKPRSFQQRPTAPVLVKHVFTSSQGIPVTMAVLPHTQPTANPEVAESQMGHYVLVQRTGAQVRRSSSAPPSNNENLVGVGGRGRPASVGEGGGDSPTPGCYPNKHALRSADCQCSLKAMIACKKCGAFWHDDCIDPSRVCVTCHIR